MSRPEDHEMELEPGPPPEEDKCPVCTKFDCVCTPECAICGEQLQAVRPGKFQHIGACLFDNPESKDLTHGKDR